MDQVKIGSFIAQRRKAKGLTQKQLAEQLGITDRAVSKWETGRAMPDASIMLALCRLLNIRVHDLLCGEVVEVSDYGQQSEQHLLELVRQKEQADKRLLRMEIFVGVLVSVVMLSLFTLASVAPMAEWVRVCLIVLGLVVILMGAVFGLRIEQTAGYYECAACGHRYVPTFGSVLWAMHMGRTRYMRCPECGKRTWQKKVLRKE